VSTETLVELFEHGLDAPICLTWELTYACNLACVHCLSSSGRRDPGELSTAECKAVIDTLERMQVFYVNIGGGEPTVRPDFWELVDYATAHHVGVKFSTNGVRIDEAVARKLAASDYVDVQISLDGATAEVNDAVRGQGSHAMAIRAMEHLAAAGFRGFKISVVVTRQNAGQLDEFKALADRYGAQLRLTRLRPSGRGADVWDELHPTAGQQRELYDWLCAHGEQVLTGDSFFHLAAYGEALPGLNMCGAGRVVCLIDPVGDVYACPFAIHENFLAGNVRTGGFEAVWRDSPLFADGPLLDALARLRDSGVAIGFSASGARQGDIVERALEVTRADARLFSAVQATWNLLETSAAPALQAASRRELTVIVKESLANGRLVTEPPDVLREVCARIGAAPDAVALAAAAAQPWANRVLIGAAGVDQLAANLRADQVALTPADTALLSGCAEDPEAYWAHRSGLPWR